MKKIIVLMLTLMMVFTVSTYASGTINTSEKSVDVMAGIAGANDFIVSPNVNDEPLAEMIKNLTNLGLVIGTIVAIAAGIIIAMKFMTDGANGKADLKQALTPYIIGVAILFGAYGIWAIIINVFVGVFSSSSSSN